MPVACQENNHHLQISYLDDSNKNCLESARLETFDDQWPHGDDSLCSRENMAKAGFFYTGYEDQVKCFVCLIKLDHWDPHDDDPWQKHEELARNCLFAKLGKEENELTVEQWCDVHQNRIINMLDAKFSKIEQAI